MCADAHARDWRETLGFGFSGDRWISDQLKGLSLCVPPGFDQVSRAVPTFTALESELVLSSEDARNFYGYAQLLHERLADLLTLWAAHDAVRAAARRFTESRDVLASMSRVRRQDVDRMLALQRDLLPLTVDLHELDELGRAATTPAFTVGRTFPIFTLAELGNKPGPQLVPQIVKGIKDEARTARQAASSTTDALKGYSDVLLAATNLQLQRRLLWFTVTVAILTGIAIAISASDSGAGSAAPTPTTTTTWR